MKDIADVSIFGILFTVKKKCPNTAHSLQTTLINVQQMQSKSYSAVRCFMGRLPLFRYLSLSHDSNKWSEHFCSSNNVTMEKLATDTSPFSPIRVWEILLKLGEKVLQGGPCCNSACVATCLP